MAVAVIMAVILVTGGVVADSDVPGTLEFFGVTVRTTSSQIFLTGAICTWALLAATWLLAAGIRRSRERGAQLAQLRGRNPSRAHDTDAVSLADVADRSALPEPGELPGHSELEGRDRLIGRGEARRNSGLKGHGEITGHREALEWSELAGLFGFASRPGRVVADRSGPGGSGDRADPGQNPAE